MEIVTFLVKEATSEQPIQSIEAMLTSLKGVERALVDVEDGEVKIEYDETQVRKDQLMDELVQQGFHVSE